MVSGKQKLSQKMRNFAQIFFCISLTFSRNFSFFSRNDDKFFKQKNLCNLEKILVSFTKFLINKYREKMRNFRKTKKQNFPQIREKNFNFCISLQIVSFFLRTNSDFPILLETLVHGVNVKKNWKHDE